MSKREGTQITLAPPNGTHEPARLTAAAADPVFRADQLQVGYRDRVIIAGLKLAIYRGGITALVGPNGSGKSTLLKTLARLLVPSAGAVYLNGAAIRGVPTSAVAREVAILPQGPVAPAGLTVGELVEQGRYPHAGPLRMLRRQDHEAITEALALTDMTGFADRVLESLSGGERQRAWIALALAQDTPVLLLDEPTTFLDIGHQLEVLDLVHRLNVERQMTILLVLHDLNQAARYADRMIVLNDGRIVTDGTPEEVLTPPLLAEVFRVRANVVRDPASGTPVCLPYAGVGTAQPPDADSR